MNKFFFFFLLIFFQKKKRKFELIIINQTQRVMKSIQEGKIFQSDKFYWNPSTFVQGIHSPGKIYEQLARNK